MKKSISSERIVTSRSRYVRNPASGKRRRALPNSKINSILPVGRETVSHLMSFLRSDERNDCASLQDVICKTCQEIADVRVIVGEALADEEGPSLQKSQHNGYESMRSSSLER